MTTEVSDTGTAGAEKLPNGRVDKRITAWVGALLLMVGIPAWMYFKTTMPAGNPQDFLPLLLVIELAALRLVWVLGSSERHLYEMVFWMFVYVFLGVAPYVQMRLGVEPGTTPDLNAAYYTGVTMAVLVGCLMWMAGSTIGARWKDKDRSPITFVVDQRRSQMFFGAVLMATFYYLISIGPSVLFESRTAMAEAYARAWPTPAVSNLITTAVPLALLVSFVAQVQALARPDVTATVLSRILVVVNFVVMFICINPITSPRYVFGTVLLAVASTAGAFSTLLRFRMMTFATVLGFIFLFPLADMFRHISFGDRIVFDPIGSMLSGDFDSHAQVVNAFEYVDENGFTWGRQLMGAILFWVPRAIWPDKPLATGIILADSKGYEFNNLSSPIWAELFVDGGWLFVVVGMFALGFLFRRLDQHVEVSLRVRRVPGLLACILPFFSVMAWRGSLMVAFSGLVVILVSAMIVTVVQPRDAFTVPRSKVPVISGTKVPVILGSKVPVISGDGWGPDPHSRSP